MPLVVGLVVGVCGLGTAVAYAIWFYQMAVGLWAPIPPKIITYIEDEEGERHVEGVCFEENGLPDHEVEEEKVDNMAEEPPRAVEMTVLHKYKGR